GLPIGILESSEHPLLLRVYPNPATDRLFILAPLLPTEVNIYNIAGSLVNHTMHPANGVIDISTLPAGIYIAEVKANGTTARCRWVKM
ncbi:MAG TPA: T9SS type A sorting domain-containing protein, partial [Chitinophagales bacterium]|nr:T9SS type A sorting domain-containing protein [Chitinophagales bacterium]